MKALEALAYLDDIAHGRKMDYDPHELKLLVEKELKALEIIKKKQVDIGLFLESLSVWHMPSINYYNQEISMRDWAETKKLSKSDFNLLKEVLE